MMKGQLMTSHERLTTVLDGHTPDRTPLSIYSWMMGDWKTNDDWMRLIDSGLGVCHHCGTVGRIEHGVEDSYEEKVDGDTTYGIARKKTPVGTLRKVNRNGWHHEDWIKTPGDYKIRQWIVENTELTTNYSAVAEAEALVGDQGIAIVTGSRTPAMAINIDWAGTEQFCMDVAMEVPELFDLFEAEKKAFLEETRLIAAGPGRFVKWFENLTISMLGHRRYGELLVSVYDEAVPILEAAGKRVMVHYDGQLGVIADQIASAPFHMIESLTEPPEGDMMYDQCRAAWPDKVFWANINLELYARPADELRAAVISKRQRAGKQALAFEISEDLPSNWLDVIPVVLDAVEECG
jgi:hypothetical protein